MRCGPTEPGRCAAEGCAPPARGPVPARHSPGERRSAAEDAVPRLVNRACLRSNQTRQINNWGETTRRPPTPQTPSSSAYPGTTIAPSGALREAPRGTEPRRSPQRCGKPRGRGVPGQAAPRAAGLPRGVPYKGVAPRFPPPQSMLRSMCTAPTAPHTRYTARRLESAGTARLFPCVQTRRLQLLPREAVITRYTPCGCLPAPRGCGHPPRTAGAFLSPSAPSPSVIKASRQNHGVESGGASPGRSHGGRR